MSEQLYRVMSDDVKQLYCIESVDGEMFSMQEIVDLLNEQLSIIRRDEMSIKTMMSNIEKLEKENNQLKQENNFLKQIREAFQIDVKNSRQMLKRWGKYD